MGTVIEKVLRANSTELIAGLNCKSGLLDYLMSVESSVLTTQEKVHILSKKRRYEQNEELIAILTTKDESALKHLHSYLKRNGYIKLAHRLEASTADLGYALPGARGSNYGRSTASRPSAPAPAAPAAERSNQAQARGPPSNSEQEKGKHLTSAIPGRGGSVKSFSGTDSSEVEDEGIDDRLEVRL